VPHNAAYRVLNNEFASTLDEALVRQLLIGSDEHLSASFNLLGEGTHFKAWLLRPGPNPSFQLVLKRPTSNFYPPGGPDYRHWRSCLMLLKKEPIPPLIPPFAVIEQGEQYGLVMPYGPDPVAKVAAHWQPLDRQTQDYKAALTKKGLYIDDILQIRVWQGIPFLIDLSDIKAVGS